MQGLFEVMRIKVLSRGPSRKPFTPLPQKTKTLNPKPPTQEEAGDIQDFCTDWMASVTCAGE